MGGWVWHKMKFPSTKYLLSLESDIFQRADIDSQLDRFNLFSTLKGFLLKMKDFHCWTEIPLTQEPHFTGKDHFKIGAHYFQGAHRYSLLHGDIQKRAGRSGLSFIYCSLNF